MLKFLFMFFMIIPMIFMKNKYWLVQNLKGIIVFLLILFGGGAGYFVNLSYGMGWDLFSYWLVLLSVWLCFLMMMASMVILKSDMFSQLFVLNLGFLLFFLILSFISMNLMMFYLFFEASLVPTLFLILGWGYQPERIQAGIYLLFYTLLISLPLLVGVIYVYDLLGSLDFNLLNKEGIEGELIYFSLILAFLVKMPMFLVHLWLPKAHVEAPISGSMILAGIMLKLGGYGLLRIYSLIQIKGVELNFFWVSISLVGGVLVSLVCFRQTDLKSLVAYSSVVHMGVVLSGIMTMTSWGIKGAYGMMIAHGLCSSGLFCLVNIVYERLGSRSLFISKGLLMLMPSLSLWWFLLCSSNMAAPPTLNLLSEIFLLNSLVSWSWSSIFLLMLVSFFGAGYTLYLFSYSQHGVIYSGVFNLDSGEVREYLLLLLHWLPLNLLILNGGLIVG